MQPKRFNYEEKAGFEDRNIQISINNALVDILKQLERIAIAIEEKYQLPAPVLETTVSTFKPTNPSREKIAENHLKQTKKRRGRPPKDRG